MPVQLPVDALNTWPACAVPEIVGALVFAGAVGAAVTTAVCAEEALLEPTLFEPVSVTRIVAPTSPVTSV